MARKGHPRVPRKIRGERNRIKRLMAQEIERRNEAWRAKRGYVRRYPDPYAQPQNPAPTGNMIHHPVSGIPVAYDALVRKALGSQEGWEEFMAGRG